MKVILTFLKRFFFILVIVLAFAASFQYLYCPVYIFPEPKPFSGDKIYNPYADMDSTCWKKANFHLHTRQWAGITNGRDNSDFAADSIYRFLNYDIIGISDYEYINRYREKEKGFVPEYEHGYMIPKNHHIVLGVKKVSWFDYPFPETLNNEQFIINLLKKDTSDVVAIAHPRMRNAVDVNNMKYLTGYDCIEVFDRLIYSVAHWDSALSSGHPAFATSVDDNHDLTDPGFTGTNCTLVNVKNLNAEAILSALKSGRTIACEMYTQGWNDFMKKRAYSFAMPIIYNIAFENNQLKISSNAPMAYVQFIGQGGFIKKIVSNSKDAAYDFNAADSYIRTDIHFADSTIYHLNPVFRYSGSSFEKPKVIVDEMRTNFHRILFYISLFALLFILYLSIKRRKH